MTKKGHEVRLENAEKKEAEQHNEKHRSRKKTTKKKGEAHS